MALPCSWITTLRILASGRLSPSMPPKVKVQADTIPDRPVYHHWLLKAEPDTRIEKGVDVKFSVDDFEKCKVTAWEGVRNHQAKRYLKEEMKINDPCLFYASNCKTPGITALAKVKREGYPDHNAWDAKHPYYDPKSSSETPTWFMIDLEFVERLPHMVPLKLLQTLATTEHATLPVEVKEYIKPQHLEAIKGSALISRGRLSVQGCTDEFYGAVKQLGQRGGWQEWFKGPSISDGAAKAKTPSPTKRAKVQEEEEKPVGKRAKKVDPKAASGNSTTETRRTWSSR
ncbi:BZ3500_MvSof-1268-A1-R1_Chr2-2g05184 [Microbotryum saponariae]|uniref:BZ3500_MvSof-1268-A1-R1_Chr2-2g05184 protein n=1 Tax=Microbotryum saponariae TaxID=289078 RepID=A0A2X0L360_9BASI|nr:BZ3500_MvSof-1268-A1-R1_Chr2-2g05184 [Microbotryum saponariae]SDA01011.1 BZ3501_MvSof-1269-A2-R1_Chr2-2g04858 [Microbotryum saponariae]